jgi:hypothetical protein
MGRTRQDIPAELRDRPFSVAEARRMGVGHGRLRGSDLARPFHGVRSASVDPTGLVERCRALAQAMGPWQVFSHRTAARLLGMPLPAFYRADEPLHVLSLEGRDGMRSRGVRGHSTTASLLVREQAGVRCVAPAVTWCHLAEDRREALGRDWLVAIGDFLLSGARGEFARQHPLCTGQELDAAIRAHGGRRGAAVLASARPLVRTPVDSVRETFLRLLLIDAGLPEPQVQVPVMTRDGLRHADLGYPEQHLLLEYLGDAHRQSRRRWLEDLNRVQLLRDAGYETILVGAADLARPSTLPTRVRRALRQSKPQRPF